MRVLVPGLASALWAACSPRTPPHVELPEGQEAGDSGESGEDTGRLDTLVHEGCRSLTGERSPVLYVAADAEVADPDGSATAPFASLSAALEAAVAGAELRLDGGEHPGPFTLEDPERHGGIALRGCGEAASVLTGGVIVRGTPSAPLSDLLLEALVVSEFAERGVDVSGAAEVHLGGALAVRPGGEAGRASGVQAADGATVRLRDGAELSGEGTSCLLSAAEGAEAVLEAGSLLDGAGGHSWAACAFRGTLTVSGGATLTAEGLAYSGVLATESSTVRLSEGSVVHVVAPGSSGVRLSGGSRLQAEGALLLEDSHGPALYLSEDSTGTVATLSVTGAGGAGLWVDGGALTVEEAVISGVVHRSDWVLGDSLRATGGASLELERARVSEGARAGAFFAGSTGRLGSLSVTGHAYAGLQQDCAGQEAVIVEELVTADVDDPEWHDCDLELERP